MVRQQRAQPATTTTPAAVHIGTQAFAVAGTNERHILMSIKDADCDLFEIMSRASWQGRGCLLVVGVAPV
jgi:hypothetical protein